MIRVIDEATQAWVREYVDARLKSQVHEARDHLDKGLSLLKLERLPLANIHSFITTTVSDTSDLSIVCGFKPRLLICFGSRNNSTSNADFGFGWWHSDEDTFRAQTATRNYAHVAHDTNAGSGNSATVRDTGNDTCFELIGSTGTVIKSFSVDEANSNNTTLVINRNTNAATAFAMYGLVLG